MSAIEAARVRYARLKHWIDTQPRHATSHEIADERVLRDLIAEHDRGADAEVREEWYVLGHPGWPMGMDFRTQAEAERFFWEQPKLDGTRDGMRVMHRTITRYPEYVPKPTELGQDD